MPNKATTIDAIKWFFGCNTKEANQYYEDAGEKLLREIVRGYIQNARNAFYDD